MIGLDWTWLIFLFSALHLNLVIFSCHTLGDNKLFSVSVYNCWNFLRSLGFLASSKALAIICKSFFASRNHLSTYLVFPLFLVFCFGCISHRCILLRITRKTVTSFEFEWMFIDDKFLETSASETWDGKKSALGVWGAIWVGGEGHGYWTGKGWNAMMDMRWVLESVGFWYTRTWQLDWEEVGRETLERKAGSDSEVIVLT